MSVRKFAFFGPFISTPGWSELRARIAEEHKAGIGPLAKAGILKYGGPSYDDSDDGAEPSTDRVPRGSFFLLEAPSRAEALKVIESDIFYKEGLWDIPNIRLVEYVALGGHPYPPA
ncbi:hypothetical protein C8F01DRAFT_1368555 [Mycena amicta]|nr:hypothetical protein C8F01DRAFT_1368555 [Mycena amicta]